MSLSIFLSFLFPLISRCFTLLYFQLFSSKFRSILLIIFLFLIFLPVLHFYSLFLSISHFLFYFLQFHLLFLSLLSLSSSTFLHILLLLPFPLFLSPNIPLSRPLFRPPFFIF